MNAISLSEQEKEMSSNIFEEALSPYVTATVTEWGQIEQDRSGLEQNEICLTAKNEQQMRAR
jgi:hypothetical protein